jgi:hypothetical protein
MEGVTELAELFGAPAVMLILSAPCFLADRRREAYGARLISCAHGLQGASLYFGTMALHWTRPLEYRPYLATPFTVALALPVLPMLVALFPCRGPKVVHLSLLAFLPALGWAAFMGSMAAASHWL